VVNALETVKLVRPLHNGLEYSIQTDDKKYVITAKDFRNIGEEILCVGNTIDEYVQSELSFCAEKLSCIQKALCHLKYSDMPEMKLRIKLKGKFSSEVIDAAMELLKENGDILCLIKPQFEAGKDKVGKKGVVRDSAVHLEVLERFLAFAPDAGFTVMGLNFSPIRGPEGNIEYLGWLKKGVHEAEIIDPKPVVEASHSSFKEAK
jgi:hypothetical protein